MIRSLRRRFLLIAMFSLALTLFVIGGSINLGNYIRLTDRADAIITTLYENDCNCEKQSTITSVPPSLSLLPSDGYRW